jgi:hypothetical protein
MKKVAGYHVTVDLPIDVERIIQSQRKKQKQQNRWTPTRGAIISEAVRGFYGTLTSTSERVKRKRAAAA